MENVKAGNSVVSTWTFRDGEQYVISMGVIDGPKALTMRIANKITAEEWGCHYEAKHIEELSQRTGNYKSFDVFVAMIKCALLKSTDSVELDLMTYEDLKALKSQRIKKGSKQDLMSPSKLAAPLGSKFEFDANGNSASAAAVAKRKYLIVKYVAEFDSVHYPLALNHSGGPDPFIMQNNIKKLQSEVTFLRNTNQELAAKLKDASKAQTQNGLMDLKAYLGSDCDMQVRSLLEAIESLERKCSSERVEHLKEMEALQNENTKLRDQIADLQLSEEDLNRQITRLERMCAAHGVHRTVSGDSIGTIRHATEADRNERVSRGRRRGPSIGLRSRHSSSSSEFRRKFVTASKELDRKVSLDRIRSRSLSPAPFLKFDPTSYIREKKMRQEQIAQMRMEQIKANFLRQERSDIVTPNGSDSGQSHRFLKPKVPSSVEIRLAAPRHRSQSLERPSSQTVIYERSRTVTERDRSQDRQYFGSSSRPTGTNASVQTKTFKTKSKVTKPGSGAKGAKGSQPRKIATAAASGKERRLARSGDFEGSLEALQSYIEETGQQLAAFKNVGKAYGTNRK